MSIAEVKSKITLDLKIHLELSLEEAKALESITGYGVDEFLKGYYKQLGKSYLQPHEKGVRSLFKRIKESLPGEIHKAEEIIKKVNSIDQNKK